MDWSLPGPSVRGILQARMLAWVAMPSTRGSSWARDWTLGLLHHRQALYHLRHSGLSDWAQSQNPDKQNVSQLSQKGMWLQDVSWREALWKALDPPRLALKTEEGALSKGRQVSSRSWKTQGNILPGPSRRSSALLTPWFLAEGDSDWTSGLQNCKIRSLSCFRHQFVITCHSISGK